MSVTLDKVSREVNGVPWIRDISLTLERGTLSVLLGPTLSGKTSIMRLLRGLDKPTSGRILVDGKDVTGFDVRKRSVAMVYQQFINYPTLTVYENIASPLRVQGVARDEIEARVRDAAKLLKLEPYLNRTPLQLSGGQQQRTAIARALVKGRGPRAARRAARQPRLQAARGTAHRVAAHFRGIRRDLRLCDDRAVRSAAARRPHHLHGRGAGTSIRADAGCVSPSRYGRSCGSLFRSAAQHSRHREEERIDFLFRR